MQQKAIVNTNWADVVSDSVFLLQIECASVCVCGKLIEKLLTTSTKCTYNAQTQPYAHTHTRVCEGMATVMH